jgi:hypothetical protein
VSSVILSSVRYLGSRAVVVRFPHPAEDCLRRLEATTSSRGHLWYLNPATATQLDPQFRGKVGPGGLELARFRETLGRNSFYAVITGQVEPVTKGDSELRGAVGLVRPVALLLPVLVFGGSIILLGVFTGGVASLVAGHTTNGIPFVLGPVLLAVFEGMLIRWGIRNVQADGVKLVEEVRCLLDGELVDPPPASTEQASARGVSRQP